MEQIERLPSGSCGMSFAPSGCSYSLVDNNLLVSLLSDNARKAPSAPLHDILDAIWSDIGPSSSGFDVVEEHYHRKPLLAGVQEVREPARILFTNSVISARY